MDGIIHVLTRKGYLNTSTDVDTYAKIYGLLSNTSYFVDIYQAFESYNTDYPTVLGFPGWHRLKIPIVHVINTDKYDIIGNYAYINIYQTYEFEDQKNPGYSWSDNFLSNTSGEITVYFIPANSSDSLALSQISNPHLTTKFADYPTGGGSGTYEMASSSMAGTGHPPQNIPFSSYTNVVILSALNVYNATTITIIEGSHLLSGIATNFSNELDINVSYTSDPRPKLVFDITDNITLSGLSLEIFTEESKTLTLNDNELLFVFLEPEPEPEPETVYDFDISYLQMEYIATSEYANETSWTPTYNIWENPGDTTSIPSGITYDPTSGSYLFADDTGSNPSGIEPPYDNDHSSYTYTLASNNGLTYEAWVSYSGTEGSIAGKRGWLINFDTGSGPALALNEPNFISKPSSGYSFSNDFSNENIGTMAGYLNSSDFKNSTNTPGSIASYVGSKVHIVSTMYQGTRSVFVNGVEYPMEDDSPELGTGDNRGKTLTIGNLYDGASEVLYCLGVRIYSFPHLARVINARHGE